MYTNESVHESFAQIGNVDTSAQRVCESLSATAHASYAHYLPDQLHTLLLGCPNLQMGAAVC